MRRVRLYLTRQYTTISFWISCAVIVLSLFFVFTLPPPIRPKTSVGIMNGLVVLFLAITVVVNRSWGSWLRVRAWTQIHMSVVWYFIAVLSSLIVSGIAQDATPLRLLFSGVVMFFLVQPLSPSYDARKTFIHVLGGFAVFIAVISLMQLTFPNLMNAIADIYFHGREAYGLAIEFNRGRLLHWGSLIFVFPFFYSSSLLLKWRERFWPTLYIVSGYVSIFAAMIMANFRWTFLVFMGITGLYFYYTQRFSLMTKRKLMLLGALLAVIIQVGILVATFVFGYNLIDRFLLSNAQRDIVETSGRILLYDQATTIFLANPIFGAGYGNYYSVVSPFPLLQLFRLLYTLKPMPVPIAAHNEFFTVLAETGILGFIGFLLLLYFTVKQAFVLMFRRTLSPVDRLLLVSIWTSLLAYCLYVIFENMFPQNIIYLLMLAGVAHGWFHKAQYEHTAS